MNSTIKIDELCTAQKCRFSTDSGKTDSKQSCGCRCRSPPRALVLQVHLTKPGESQNQDSASANSTKLLLLQTNAKAAKVQGQASWTVVLDNVHHEDHPLWWILTTTIRNHAHQMLYHPMYVILVFLKHTLNKQGCRIVVEKVFDLTLGIICRCEIGQYSRSKRSTSQAPMAPVIFRNWRV